MSPGNFGFASLRAKFEQKDESTSPPSRGRSPAASSSVTGDGSRQISKVRTSFVSVEPSGQMGEFNVSEKSDNKGAVANGDGAEESTPNGAVTDFKTNGIDSTPQKSHRLEENGPKQMTPKTSSNKQDSTLHENLGTANGITSTAHPDKPSSAAEDDTALMLPSDPKDAAAVSDGAALAGEASPLGSILKGSPFEQDDRKGQAPNALGLGAAVEPTQSSEQQAKDPSTPMSNGKPKESPAQKAGPQSKTKITSRPSNLDKKSAAQPASPTAEKAESEPQTSILPAPMTPNSKASPFKRPPPKKMSPKTTASKEPKKEVLKDQRKTTAERLSRSTIAPKVPAAASKPGQKPGKKSGPTSPPSFTKPRPKSPTRPVRLPSSATAPTAASAAKLDATSPNTAKSRNRIPSNPTSLRQKSIRTSLPVGSKPEEKAKPKSRLSTTSSKAVEGSFLDRMMRPTQSSSQKTHEKMEAKTPPKKITGARPKSKSDASEKARNENVEMKGQESTESAPSAPVEGQADPSRASATNGATKGIEENPPASGDPLPTH